MDTKTFNSKWRGTSKELNLQLREQGRQGYGWLCINRYGAICLNTNEVFFGDIDCILDEESSRRNQKVIDPKEAHALIESVANKYKLCFRVYQTYAGIRIIEISKKHNPLDPETNQILTELKCDPFFIDLVKRTNTFRARLTPKPWRVSNPKSVHFKRAGADIATYLKGTESKPGPKWQIAKYLYTVGNPPEVLDSEISFIVDLHDDYCNTNDERPLA